MPTKPPGLQRFSCVFLVGIYIEETTIPHDIIADTLVVLSAYGFGKLWYNIITVKNKGDTKMTNYQKRENLEKRMYKEIANGNFDKADKIRKQIVDMDVASLAKKLAK